MITRKSNLKGLQDIRTLSGNVDMVFEPYRAYMKISCLEMEKARRGNERKSALHRLKNIDARFKEISEEKKALLRSLGDIANKKQDSLHRGNSPDRCREPKGFKIKY